MTNDKTETTPDQAAAPMASGTPELLISPDRKYVAYRSDEQGLSRVPWTGIPIARDARGIKHMTPEAVAAWDPLFTVAQAEWAMFGDSDGGLLPDECDVPVGELRRLLHDVEKQVRR